MQVAEVYGSKISDVENFPATVLHQLASPGTSEEGRGEGRAGSRATAMKHSVMVPTRSARAPNPSWPRPLGADPGVKSHKGRATAGARQTTL
jgi:hypothetical protein